MRAQEPTARPEQAVTEALFAAAAAAARRLFTTRPPVAEVRALRRDDLVRVKSGRSVGAVECRGGTCLVTQKGDPEDHVLVAGGVFRPTARGLVVVWALTEAEVALLPASRRPAPTI